MFKDIIIEQIKYNNELSSRNDYVSNNKNKRKKFIIRKYSAGIILFDIVKDKNFNNIYNVLLVKKRTTLAFYLFICETFNYKSEESIKNILSKTTFEEKKLIQKLPFDELWRVIWVEPTYYNKNSYEKLKKEYERKFHDKKYLTKILNECESIEIEYSIPRGRIEKKEKPYETAIREFYEETGIKTTQFYPILNFNKAEKIIDNNLEYTYKYFLAITTKNNLEPMLKINNKFQYRELSELKWISMNTIKEIDYNLYLFLRPCVNFIKKNKYYYHC